MNPRDFLEIAGDWAFGEHEAEWRSAASRAYYAAFHTVRQLFTQVGFRVPLADRAHSYLSLRLTNSGHADVCKAGTDLKSLRRVRNRADYDLDTGFHQREAEDQVQLAMDVVQLIETLSRTPPILGPVVNSIKTYERHVLGEVTWHP